MGWRGVGRQGSLGIHTDQGRFVSFRCRVQRSSVGPPHPAPRPPPVCPLDCSARKGTTVGVVARPGPRWSAGAGWRQPAPTPRAGSPLAWPRAGPAPSGRNYGGPGGRRAHPCCIPPPLPDTLAASASVASCAAPARPGLVQRRGGGTPLCGSGRADGGGDLSEEL